MKLEHSLIPYIKINSKWIKDLNVRRSTTEFLEENIGKIRFDINSSNIFLDLSPRVMEIKTNKKRNKWDLTTLMAEREEELKRLLMKVKEESEKVGLKLNIQKTKIMASGPNISWQVDGETMETVTDFIFSGSKIIADGDCSHEIKRCLLLGRKAMTNLDSVLKSRDITLPIKVRLVKAMVFPVVMYGCESWTIKKAER